MNKVTISQDFSFAHGGTRIEALSASPKAIEATDELADWIDANPDYGKVVERAADAEAKALDGAPENRDRTGAVTRQRR